jgi:hypothetical protein
MSENVAQSGYLGTSITNQNLIQEEIKRRLNSGNACYHSVQAAAPAHAGSLADFFFFFYLEDGGDTFLRNVG